jgi:hypothetical protein
LLLLTIPARPPPADPGVQPKLYNATTRNTYILNTQRLNFSAGEQFCNDNGGHLVAYTSADEQLSVEQYFTQLGVLFPDCHLNYWMGLTTEQWPNFFWTDK